MSLEQMFKNMVICNARSAYGLWRESFYLNPYFYYLFRYFLKDIEDKEGFKKMLKERLLEEKREEKREKELRRQLRKENKKMARSER